MQSVTRESYYLIGAKSFRKVQFVHSVLRAILGWSAGVVSTQQRQVTTCGLQSAILF